jgi:hypothetical protein
MPKRLFLLGLVMLTLGCNSIFGPSEQRVVGVIEGLDTDAPSIVVPESVRAGEDFTVTIGTTWRNTCARKDATEVRVQGASATVTPYERVTEGGACGDMVQHFTHTATLRFAQPGTAEIVVRGRASHTGGVRTIQRSVTVQ